MGATPYSAFEQYQSASVIEQMQKFPKPTLLLHGTPDTLVWFKQSERLYLRLQEQKIPSVFIQYSWAPHGFDYNLSGPAGQVAYNSVLYFVKELLK
jgi:dipeptidyl aminopeptidase/acylaminoacyl peptidase